LLLLSEPSIEVAHQPRMSILTFRYCPQGDHSDAVIDAASVAIRKSLSRSGSAVIAGTKVHGRQYLKFTFLNPAATIQDVQFILKLIKQHGQAYFGQPARAPSAETLYAR
jgi:L-2,4-diaminobutyrate decarboxylase